MGDAIAQRILARLSLESGQLLLAQNHKLPLFIGTLAARATKSEQQIASGHELRCDHVHFDTRAWRAAQLLQIFRDAFRDQSGPANRPQSLND